MKKSLVLGTMLLLITIGTAPAAPVVYDVTSDGGVFEGTITFDTDQAPDWTDGPNDVYDTGNAAVVAFSLHHTDDDPAVFYTEADDVWALVLFMATADDTPVMIQDIDIDDTDEGGGGIYGYDLIFGGGTGDFDTHTNVTGLQMTPAAAPPAILIDLDPADLVADATIDEWINNGTLGGSFKQQFGDPPTVSEYAGGISGATIQIVTTDGTQNNTLFDLRNAADAIITVATAGLGGGEGGNPYTLQAWLNRQVGQDGGENTFFAWGARGPNVAQFDYGDSGGSGCYVSWQDGDIGWPDLPAAGEWHHVAYSHTGSALTVYLDGLPVTGMDPSQSCGESYDPISLFNIYTNEGPPPSGNHDGMSGSYAKIQVHNTALSIGEIQASFLADREDYQTNTLLGMLNLDAPGTLIEFGNQDFGAGPTASVTVTLSNGNAMADVNFTGAEVAITGADAAEFGFNFPDNSPIVNGAPRDLTVWADPVADNDFKQAVLEITTDSGNINIDLTVNPAIIYVDDDGDDVGGDGSVGNPYATIQKGVDVSNVGSTIHIETGTYGDFSLGGASRKLLIDADDGPGTATLAGSVIDLSATAPDYIIVTLQDLDIAPAVGSVTDEGVLQIDGDGNKDITIDGCTLTANSVAPNPGTSLIHTVQFSNDGVTNITVLDSVIDGAGVAHGIWTTRGGTGDLTVTDSLITDVDSGIINGLFGSLVVERCTVDTAKGRGIYHGGRTPLDGDWWWDTGGGTALVNRCYVVDCLGDYMDGADWDFGGHGIFIFQSEGPTIVTNTIVEKCEMAMRFGWTGGVNNTQIYNNTIIGEEGMGLEGIFDDGGSNVFVHNSIFLGFTNNLNVGGVTESNNITDVAVDGDPDFAYQAGGVFAPPVGIQGAAGYDLADTSACLGAGIDVGVDEDYAGNARPLGDPDPDIGAYESDKLDVTTWEIY